MKNNLGQQVQKEPWTCHLPGSNDHPMVSFVLRKIPENWEEYKAGGLWDKYFIYERCIADQRTGLTFYNRHVRPEYEGKIPNELMHKDIAIISQYVSINHSEV